MKNDYNVFDIKPYKMWHYLKEHGFAFKLGAAGSVGIWGNVLFADISFISNPALAYIIKIIGAAAIAFVTGLATCLATDFHKEIKKRYKNFKDGKRKQDQNDKAA